MPDQPFPSDLISDYLDNQLSTGLRADFESQLARDPTLKMLVDGLQRQSAECRNLPPFRLDDGFAERLLNSKELQAAMPESPARASPIVTRPAGIRTRHPLRTAAIAIASLAALVLITLFLPIPGGNVVPVASKVSDVAAKDLALDAHKSKTEAAAAEDALAEEFGSNEIMDSKSAETDLDTSRKDRAPPKVGFKADHSQNAPSGSVAKSQSPDSMKNLQPHDSTKKDTYPQGKELAQNVEKDSTADWSKGNSVDPGAADGQDALAMEQQELNFGEPNHIGDRPVPSVVVHQPLSPDAGAGATGQPATAGDLNDVIEIRYVGGPEMLTEFHSALTRNEISIDAAPQVKSGPTETPDDSGAKPQTADSREFGESQLGGGVGELGGSGMGGGGRGGGGRGSALNDKTSRNPRSDELELGVLPQFESQLRDQSTQFEAGSQAYLLTATPGQMVGLITDLQNQANVSVFRLSNTTPETSPLDELKSETGVDPAAQSPDAEPANLSELDRRSQSVSPGQAIQLAPQMELRELRSPGGGRGFDGRSQPPMNELLRQKQVLPQTSGDSSESLNQLKIYFGALDRDLPAQKYLLLVHTDEAMTDANVLPETAPVPPGPAADDDK